ncbi:VOC family protein [Paenibacillus sp. M1]|uniref:VOC family protein n=1 Tax=Paenibacillus haidiansis TaxID=1574488 RepID=A0ABU7VVP6_9BACL
MISLGSMSINVVTLFVEDLHTAKSFYQEIFGLSVAYEDENSAVFDFANMSINLLDVSSARSLIAPEAVANQEAGSRFQFTIRIDDVDAVCAELNARGVTLLNGPMNRPWGVRTASFADPSGHIWEIAQQLT